MANYYDLDDILAEEEVNYTLCLIKPLFDEIMVAEYPFPLSVITADSSGFPEVSNRGWTP